MIMVSILRFVKNVIISKWLYHDCIDVYLVCLNSKINNPSHKKRLVDFKRLEYASKCSNKYSKYIVDMYPEYLFTHLFK